MGQSGTPKGSASKPQSRKGDEPKEAEPKQGEPKQGEPKKKESTSWKNNLVKNGKSYAACLSNLISIFTNEPAWRGVLAYDEFTAQVVKLKNPPWHADDRPSGKLTGPWIDGDGTRAAAWVTREWNDIKPNEGMVESAIRVVAERTRVHPVRDWLESLTWDGKPRLDTWLVRLAGAEDTPYTRAVSAMFAIGAVARIMQPGCKLDHTLVIEGKTGRGKSTLLRVLTGEEWFLETEIELGSKDFYQTLHGKWIIELAELDALKRGELSRVKAVLTKRIDTYRESYGRHRKDFPRQCVFTGTTEEDTYLKDEKGNRRFWPVLTGDIKVNLAAKERPQLWAEAVARFSKGEQWHITDRSLLGLFEAEQEWRRDHDPWEAPILKWLRDHPRRWTDGTTTEEIMTSALGITDATKQGRFEQIRAGAILRKFGWERHREWSSGGVREYIYRPLPDALKALRTAKDLKDKEAVNAVTKAIEEGNGKVVPFTKPRKNKGSEKAPRGGSKDKDEKPRKT